MRAIGKLLATALFAFSLEGCASDVMDYSQTPMPREYGQTTVENDGHKPLQCVPYAREHSNIKIFGDAWTWWDKAAGIYARGTLPEPGAVLSFPGIERMPLGHVAVVTQARNVSPGLVADTITKLACLPAGWLQ